MNNLLHLEHRSAVLSLTTQLAALAWENLCRRDPTFPPPHRPPSPADLLNALDEHPVDHLTLLLPTCRDARPEAVQALETLLGRPLTRPLPRGRATPSAPRSSRIRDHRPVLVVAPNPKKADTASFMRYQHWKEGQTVEQCIAQGLARADVAWDTGHGFVTLGPLP